jgi:hypothetical protein
MGFDGTPTETISCLSMLTDYNKIDWKLVALALMGCFVVSRVIKYYSARTVSVILLL